MLTEQKDILINNCVLGVKISNERRGGANLYRLCNTLEQKKELGNLSPNRIVFICENNALCYQAKCPFNTSRTFEKVSEQLKPLNLPQTRNNSNS